LHGAGRRAEEQKPRGPLRFNTKAGDCGWGSRHPGFHLQRMGRLAALGVIAFMVTASFWGLESAVG